MRLAVLLLSLILWCGLSSPLRAEANDPGPALLPLDGAFADAAADKAMPASDSDGSDSPSARAPSTAKKHSKKKKKAKKKTARRKALQSGVPMREAPPVGSSEASSGEPAVQPHFEVPRATAADDAASEAAAPPDAQALKPLPPTPSEEAPPSPEDLMPEAPPAESAAVEGAPGSEEPEAVQESKPLGPETNDLSIKEVLDAPEYVEFAELDPVYEQVIRWDQTSAKFLYIPKDETPFIYLTGTLAAGYEISFDGVWARSKGGRFQIKVPLPFKPTRFTMRLYKPDRTFRTINYIGVWLKLPPSLRLAGREKASIFPKKKPKEIVFQSSRRDKPAAKLVLNFATLVARLNPVMMKKVTQFIKDLEKQGEIEDVHFVGHTDSDRIIGRGRLKFKNNYILSQARAKSVAVIFAKRFPKLHMSYDGRGPDVPVATNATREGKAKNRRTEVLVYFKEEPAAMPRELADEEEEEPPPQEKYWKYRETYWQAAFAQIYSDKSPVTIVDLDSQKHAKLTIRIFQPLQAEESYDGWKLTIRNREERVIGEVSRYGAPPLFIDWREIATKVFESGPYTYQITLYKDDKPIRGATNHFLAIEGLSLLHHEYLPTVQFEPREELGYFFFHNAAGTRYAHLYTGADLPIAFWNRFLVRFMGLMSLSTPNPVENLTYTRLMGGFRFFGNGDSSVFGYPYITRVDLYVGQAGYTVGNSTVFAIRRYTQIAILLEPHVVLWRYHYLIPWIEYGSKPDFDQQRFSMGITYNFFIRPWSTKLGLGISYDNLFKFDDAPTMKFNVMRTYATFSFFL